MVALLEAEVVQANLKRAVVGAQVRVEGGKVAQVLVHAQLLIAVLRGGGLDPADTVSVLDVVAPGKVEGDLDIDPEVDAVGLILGVRGWASVDSDDDVRWRGCRG